VGGVVATGGTEDDFILDAAGGALPAYSGYWSTPAYNTGHSASAVLDLLPANTVDPAGGSDYFINGVIAMAQPQQDTLLP
jgi:hypothetical protein